MLVVTLPASAQKNPLAFALKAQKAGADILEIRADLITALPAFTSPLPILLALRGGDPDWIQILKPTYVDVELPETGVAIPPGIKVIRSYHNYENTPSLSQLTDIADQLIMTGADIIKIAVMINHASDLLTLKKLRESLTKNQRRVILGMGDKAHLSRILSPFQNELTYTFLDGHPSSAPGQLPISFYKQTAHIKTPRIFGLLGGKQAAKSLSLAIHNSLFAKHDIDAAYSLFIADELEETFETLEEMHIQGLSVTAPFKVAAYAKSQRLDVMAERLQSVNTIIKEGDGWAGYNTDFYGLVRGYPFLADCRHISILGSGGVVPAIIAACEHVHRGVRIDMYARNQLARQEIEERFGIDTYDIERIYEAEFDCIICSVTEDISFSLPTTHTHPYAIDLRYGKQTKFLKTAQSKNYRTYDGLPMLTYQALKQYELFTGNVSSPEDEQLIRKVLKQ